MAKCIKRAGIVFFVLVLSLLLAVGTICATGVVENNSNSIVNTNSQNNIFEDSNASTDFSAGNIGLPSNSKTYEVPKADFEFELSGNFSEMSAKWNEIFAFSEKTIQTIKVTLKNDWIAEDHVEYETYFGDGTGFINGAIYYDSGAPLIFDLNGKMLDRRLNGNQIYCGMVIMVGGNGNFIITDTNYNAEKAIAVYNGCKAENNDFANLKSKLREKELGIITGGSTNDKTFGGGVRAIGNLAMYGGIIMDNTANCGAGVFSSSIFNFYAGIIMRNTANVLGGGIYALNSELNLHNGIILYNDSENRGGGIAAEGALFNMVGGMICENHTSIYGAGVHVENGGTFNMYGGKISYNRMNRSIHHEKDEYGGGVYTGSSFFNMYGGEISYNYDSRCGGGLILHHRSTGVIYGGKIINNETIVLGGGIFVYNMSKLTIYDIEVSGNIVDRVEDRYDAGAGISVENNSVLEMYGGNITNNKIINDEPTNRSCNGGGIFIMANCSAYLNGGVIANNSIESTDTTRGGGVYFQNTGDLRVGGAVQIYGNKIKGADNADFIDSDVNIDNDKKLYISDALAKTALAKIGIYFDNTDIETNPDKEFTTGYRIHNNFDARLAFFSNKENEVIKEVVTENGFSEAAMENGTKPTACLTWSWEGSQSGSTNDKDVVQVVVAYSGEDFVIEMEGKDFYITGGNLAKSFTVKEAGIYSFYTIENCLNNNFTFVVEPKEVDVLWKNTDMIYNGGYQKPIAYIAEDANCKVTTTGEQINSRSYIATAIELSNKNYKINTATMTQTFSINKAKLNKPSGEINYEYDGSQKEFLPTGFDSKTMNITGNTATNVGSYTATISLKDKANYEWVDKTNNDVTINYAITLIPQVEEGEYKFIYIDEEGYRKTYKQGGIVHGVNDSDLNGGRLVLGNIAPNTSVKRFVETLGYDTSKIVIKDSAEKEIYVNGVPVDQSTYDKRFELAVGTGWRVEYTTTGGTEIIYLSVLGDINGDGRISASDCAYLREIANDKALYDNLNAEIKLASLIINKGKVTSADSEIVLNVINQKLTMDLFF